MHKSMLHGHIIKPSVNFMEIKNQLVTHYFVFLL